MLRATPLLTALRRAPAAAVETALADVALGDHLNSCSLEEVIAQHGGVESAPWSHTIVRNEHLFVTAICHDPDQYNDNHVHDYDEWWYVMNGEIDWDMEDVGVLEAKEGDFVFAPALKFHHIHPKTKGSIRLAISFPGAGHLHETPARAMKFSSTEEGLTSAPPTEGALQSLGESVPRMISAAEMMSRGGGSLVASNGHCSSSFIMQDPDGPETQMNDNHVHDSDESWVIVNGEIDWEICDGATTKTVHAKKGDIVHVPALTFHHIQPRTKDSVRLALSLPGHGHLHERPLARAAFSVDHDESAQPPQ